MEAKTLTPTRYIIIGTGEGASVQVVTGDIHQRVHDSFCSCESPWEQCATEFIKEDVRRLDNPDEWATDEDGREFSIYYEGEQYSMTVYKDWNSAPDTAKEQAGRKMFEALESLRKSVIGIIWEPMGSTGDSSDWFECQLCSAKTRDTQHLRHLPECPMTKSTLALDAGREAGWGQ